MKQHIIHLTLVLFITLFISIDRSGAETINVTLSGDAVCNNVGPPNVCRIENITPSTPTVAEIGDTVEFDITINNMEHIQLGSDVVAGVEYLLNTTGIPESPDDLFVFNQTIALSDENGNLITDIFFLDGVFITSGGVVDILFLNAEPIADFDNKTLHDVHASITSEVFTGNPIGTYDIRVDNVFLSSSTGKVGKWPEPPATVPTLSQWGLIAMAGVLGVVGFMVMRRRKATA